MGASTIIAEGIMINEIKVSNQGVEKVELEFNKDGSLKTIFIKRRPEKCGWSNKLTLDNWKLI